MSDTFVLTTIDRMLQQCIATLNNTTWKDKTIQSKWYNELKDSLVKLNTHVSDYKTELKSFPFCDYCSTTVDPDTVIKYPPNIDVCSENCYKLLQDEIAQQTV